MIKLVRHIVSDPESLRAGPLLTDYEGRSHDELESVPLSAEIGTEIAWKETLPAGPSNWHI